MTTDERNALVKELADLGRAEAKSLAALIRGAEPAVAVRHLAKLEANRARRCEILTSIVTHPDAGVSGDVIAYATAPKEK